MTDHQLVDLGIEGLDHAVHIGAGGAADVYRAEQLGLGRTVAVKILRSTTSGKNQARFERETQSLGRLSSHPGIVTLFQAGITVRGQAFLIMEYCPKGTLADHISTHGPFSWQEACKIVSGIATVVGEAHQSGVLHRDLKPANVLIGERGNYLIADFGVAALSSNGDFSAATDFTPGYAPPETLRGEPAAPAGDVYALGAMAHALMTGRVPFEATDTTNNNVLAWIRRVETETPEDLRTIGVPDDVARVVEEAMAKKVDDRLGIESLAAHLGSAGDGIRIADLGANDGSASAARVPSSAPAEPNTTAVGEVLPRPPVSTEVPLVGVGPVRLSRPSTDQLTTEASSVLPAVPTTLDRDESASASKRWRLVFLAALGLFMVLVASALILTRSEDDPLTESATDSLPSIAQSSATSSPPSTARSTISTSVATTIPTTSGPVEAEAVATLSSGEIVLEGLAPSRASAAAILEAVTQVYSESQIDDRLEIDSNASSMTLVLVGELGSAEHDSFLEALSAIDDLEIEDRLEVITTTTPPPTNRPVTTRSRPATTSAPATPVPATAAPVATAPPATTPPTTAAPPSTVSETSSMLG